MTITQATKDNVLVLTLEGRLDTGTAPEAQKTMLAAAGEGKDMLLDFSGTVYVSSAGLRALLVLQKQMGKSGRTLTLSGVRPEIMEVFEMTGFAAILNIQ